MLILYSSVDCSGSGILPFSFPVASGSDLTNNGTLSDLGNSAKCTS